MGSGSTVELTTLDEFRRRRAEGVGVFVIVDRPSGRVLVHDVSCPFLTDDAFRAKVLEHRGRNGRYRWSPDAETAIEAHHAVRCQHPADPVGSNDSPGIGSGVRRHDHSGGTLDPGDGRALASTTRFRLGEEFPREGFVQRSIESHFAGSVRVNVGHADFACTDERGRRWLIEAKGQTSDVGLDFRTGLGQLLQGASEPGWTLALAMPDTPQFAHQRKRTPHWIRDAIGLHWLIVGVDGDVAVHPPKEL